MHHKRRRPKSQRSGCLLCKPHKANHSRMKTREPMLVYRHLGSLKWAQPKVVCDDGE